MRKLFIVFVLFITPLISFGKTYTLPSGIKISVEEPKYTWVERMFVLPSGLLWKEIVPVAKAETPTTWEGYPLLKKLCSCESWWSPNGEPRQFREDGSILWGQDKNGKIVKRDVGACQIATNYWLKTSQELGYNIFTYEGNIGFAKWLYDREGSRPWNASRACWKQ